MTRRSFKLDDQKGGFYQEGQKDSEGEMATAAPGGRRKGWSSVKQKGVGLGILIDQIPLSEANKSSTTLVTKSCVALIRMPAAASQSEAGLNNHLPQLPAASCFLTYCFLCNTKLRPDKDVYMYRGNQAYCSVGCRSRQIFVDEMKRKTETLGKKKSKLQSSEQYCRMTADRLQTKALLALPPPAPRPNRRG